MYLTTTSQIILNHLQAQFDSTFRNPTELDNLIGQVYNKDVVEYLSLFPDESVDLILTDEPYGVAETRLNLKSRKDNEEP